MENKMLTLEKFEEAAEVVKRVTQETKLVYSDFYSNQTGNKVYLKPENMQFTGAYKLRGGEKQRAYHRFCRKSCPGSCLCSQMLRCQGSDRDANHNSADQGKQNQKLWSGSGSLRGCL